MFKRISILVISILLITSSLFAGTNGKISGKVVDRETGEPLPGANVIIVGTSYGSAAGVNGQFLILDVPPGLYAIKSQFIGYRAVEIQNVRVTVDLTTSLTFEMPSQAIEGEDVVIVAERPLIDRDATSEVHVKRSEDIENMPIRGYQNIVATQAGVVQVGNNLYIRGSRAEEVAYYVDGVYMNNAYNLTRSGDLITNSIEEVSFQAGGFGAEYGSANGGVINTATKVGGKKFKISGEAFSDELLLSKDEKNYGAYSYGQKLGNLAVSGPLAGNRIKFYVAAELTSAADRTPSAGAHAKIISAEYDTIVSYYAMSPEHKAKFGVDSVRSVVYRPIPETIIAEKAFGPRPNNSRDRMNVSGNVVFDYQPIRFRVGGTFTSEDDRNWARPFLDRGKINGTNDLFNIDNMTRTETTTYSAYIHATHSLNDHSFYKIQLSRFSDDSKTGDDFWWEDFSEYGDKTDWNGNGIYNTNLREPGANQRVESTLAIYQPKGTIEDDYFHTISTHTGLKVDLLNQKGNHEIKIGTDFRWNTIKYYRLALPMDIAALYANKPDSLNSSTFEQTVYRTAYAENLGFNYLGGDTDIPERDKARKPVNGALYFQDKIELEDIILNLGLRWDYLNPNAKSFVRPDSIVLINGEIADENLVDGKTHSLISPRIGLAFPVSDRTVFHAQYGKYFQQPRLDRLFVSYVRFANNLQAGNFTITGNPDLKPEKQTQYEVGFQQQIGQSASLDVTGFYREMRDYVQIRNQLNSAGGGYATYVNGDYGTVKGLTFSFDLRRTSKVMGSASYTYQAAAGTGSTDNGQFRMAWQGGHFPTYVSPLDFDQRHTGSINIDYRIPEGEGIRLLQRAGVNFLYKFGSGRRYTPSEVAPGIFAANVSNPVAGINTGTMPFNSQLDMRLNKILSFGGSTFDVYILVYNLFDTKNATNVYNGTGEADNDGYFTTTSGKAFKELFPEGSNLYDIRLDNPGNWGPPRQILFGVKFAI